MNISDLTVYPKQFTDLVAKTLGGSTRVVNGLTLSATGAGSLSVTVAAGTLWVNGTFVNYAGGTVTPGAAGTLPRYDCIRIASGAAVPSVVAGTAASTPTIPALGANDLFLGYVFIGAGATDYTSATSAFINDYTLPLTLGDGTAARPSLPFANSLQTGPYLSGNGYAIAVEGVGRNITTSNGDFVPVATSIDDLGTSTLRWRDVNAVSIRADAVSTGDMVVASLHANDVSAVSIHAADVSATSIHAGDVSAVSIHAADVSATSIHATDVSATSLHVTTASVAGTLVGSTASFNALFVNGVPITGGAAHTGCRVFNSTNIALTSGGNLTTLTFDSERWDTASMHSSTANTGRITFTASGYYMVGLNAELSAAAQSEDVLFRMNGADYWGITKFFNTSLAYGVGAFTYIFASVSTMYMEALVQNNAASAVSANAVCLYSPEFWAFKVG